MKKLLFLLLVLAGAINGFSQIDCPPKNPNGPQDPPRGPGGGLPIIIQFVLSGDPNEIIGPDGVGDKKWVSVNDRLPYTILFENMKSATAPAKLVKVVYPVDAKQDKATLQLGSFGFNNQTFTIPANRSSYYGRLDVVDSLGIYVDITAGLDVVNNEIFWIFESLDPATMLPPNDPFKGFLLQPDSTDPYKGHGFVNFSIKPLSTDITGDTMSAKADIIFDTNEIIPTNTETNTVDAVAPTSTINSGVSFITPTNFRISWRGVDDLHGSGVATYSLYVSVNSLPYTLYREDIKDTALVFNGLMGQRYCFFTTATDSTGNEEELKSTCGITVNISPGNPLPVTWLYFTTVKVQNDALLTWATATEINNKWFVVERSLNGSQFTAIGTVTAAGNSTTVTSYTYTDKDIHLLGSTIVYYRLRQVDLDDKFTFSRTNLLRIDDMGADVLVNAYPNPFTNTITVQITPAVQSDKTQSVDLYSLYGTLLYHKEVNRQGSHTLVLNDLPTLPSGMYILKTTIGGKQTSLKLIRN